MQVAFDIEPFVGALPVRFGMNRDEVHASLGRPEASRPIWNKSGTTDYWNKARINVGYDNAGTVTHAGFGPGGYTLSLRGRQLWSIAEQPDPNPLLLLLDPTPLESVGILIFPAIGISTSGYHDDDDAQLSVTASPPGAWDDVLKKARPPNLERYRSR
jgi:hypothetical protein